MSSPDLENEDMSDKYSGLIEAMLFYENDIVPVEKIMKHTGLSKAKVTEIVDSLKKLYDDNDHGISIAEVAHGYTFQIKKNIYPHVKEIYNLKKKGKLSKTALTVLSIIAYKQPITKAEIEDIRGVASDNAVRGLLEKSLIQIEGRKEDVLGKPLMYGTSKEFLKHFNLKNIKELPQLNELKADEFTLDEDDDDHYGYSGEEAELEASLREETSGTQEEASGTQEEASGTQEEASGTQEETSGTQEETSGTQEETSGTQEEASGTQEETSDTQEETSDTQEETSVSLEENQPIEIDLSAEDDSADGENLFDNSQADESARDQ